MTTTRPACQPGCRIAYAHRGVCSTTADSLATLVQAAIAATRRDEAAFNDWSRGLITDDERAAVAAACEVAVQAATCAAEKADAS